MAPMSVRLEWAETPGPVRGEVLAWLASIPCRCRVSRHWPGMLRHAARRQYNKLNPILFLYPTVLRLLARSADGVTHYGLAIVKIPKFYSFYRFVCVFFFHLTLTQTFKILSFVCLPVFPTNFQKKTLFSPSHVQK